jgi:mannosyltransferase
MPRTPLQVLAAITAFAALLRFLTLDLQSFWLDEAVTAQLVRESFGDMLSTIPDSESTPPLYYVLAWGWSQVFGGWEVGLRSLSALFGTATVPVAYAIGARVASERAGLAAAALVAVNPLLVWYSQEARAYALLVLLSACALLFFIRSLEQWLSRDLAWWAVFAALSLATHYFAVFVIVPEAVWLLVAARRREQLPAAARAVALPVLAGAALLPLAVDQRSNEFADYIDETSLATRIAQIPKQLFIGFDAPLELILVPVALGLAAFAIWLLWKPARSDTRARLRAPARVALAGLALPLLVALVGVDYLLTRNVIAVVVPLAVLLAAGFVLDRGGVAALAGLCAISVAVVIAVALEPDYQRDDWRGVADEIGPTPRERAIVVSPFNGRIPLALYLPGTTRFPDTGGSVDDIYAVGLAENAGGQEGEPPKLPKPANDYALIAFQVTEQVYEDTYTVVRLRSETPQGISRDVLGLLLLTPRHGAILRQAP